MSRTWVTSELDKWGVHPNYHHIFRLFEVLLNPPPDVDLKAIDGLSGYLSNLCTQLVKSPDNGVCTLISHCWWVVHGIHCISMPTNTCSDIPTGLCNHSSKKDKWKSLLSHLEVSQRWLINWCPTIKFPSEEKRAAQSSRAYSICSSTQSHHSGYAWIILKVCTCTMSISKLTWM